MKRVRCAIYTRKSSEEGLEQTFNSLDAQREACLAYIESQRHEGWRAIPTPYDDGGFSGGTMDRPALTRLLADVEAGRLDTIVVYKVDRLTCSLADFARIVEQLEAAQVSFVSVTQQFSTTSSMGRLTLNVLLSFAQFEREVTGERIRDKIAASKRKGMWMGGQVPLGYDLHDRQLLVNPEEADRVRLIFHLYLELKCVHRLKIELETRGMRSKVRIHQTGRISGGHDFCRGALYAILKNREGRKYGLNICLSTQRPRDITEGVLSQIGTLIVHRLTNDQDRAVVERACGEIDRSASAFLPNLRPGEAAIIGADFPIPLTIQIRKPQTRPKSDGPNFQEHWK